MLSNTVFVSKNTFASAEGNLLVEICTEGIML